jgi:hypothetical protein
VWIYTENGHNKDTEMAKELKFKGNRPTE